MTNLRLDQLPEHTSISDLKGYEKKFQELQLLSYDKENNTLKLKKTENFAETLVNELEGGGK